uniref:Uncharacterized protein n=1 Tax=uncultured bacterium contig00015 TaxID=1181506 RepID=A0A806K2Q9_9BACT|nr:hypothetical protein [uncultured bacterium contig00015]
MIATFIKTPMNISQFLPEYTKMPVLSMYGIPPKDKPAWRIPVAG